MRQLLLPFILSGCVDFAFGEGIPSLSERGDRQGAAAQRLGGVLQSVDAVFCPLDAVGGGDNDLLLFPDEAQVVMSCSTQQMVCWTEGDSTDITFTLATMVVTDAASGTGIGQDGRGACARIEAGSARTMVLDLGVFRQTGAVARRVGVCENASGIPQGRPCRQNSDCQTSASHTCDIGTGATGNQVDVTGAFLCGTSADCAWVNEGFAR